MIQRLVAAGFIMLGLFNCSSESLTSDENGVRSSTSGPLALSTDGRSLWVVNPDADSVTRVNTKTHATDDPIPVGREPWAVAVSPYGVVVMNRASGSLSFVADGQVVDNLLVGPEPGGLALSPSGRLAYVTMSSSDEVAMIDVQQRAIISRIPVARLPWSVAVSNDGDTDDADESVIVSHRLSRLRTDGLEGTNTGKDGVLSVIRGEQVQEIVLTPYDFGFVNNLEGLYTVDDRVYLAHLLNSPDNPRSFKDTVSGALSTVSLTTTDEITDRRIHLNEEGFSTPVNFPRAIAVTPDGLNAYIVLAGSNAVMGISLDPPAKLIGFWPAGDNPRGIVLNHDTAYVMNYLSRDVSVLDLTDPAHRMELARIPVVQETLAPDILKGKMLFNNATDPRLSTLGWMSCASCHLDGGGDGTSWKTPEGLRQTMPLWNLAAPFHASATRDELQDFELDIEQLMAGIGLAPNVAAPLLQTPNRNRSSDLDALANFVLEGFDVPVAPAVNYPERFAKGRQLFEELNCAMCHGGPNWTRSHLPGEVGTLAVNGQLEVEAVLHDVGTFDARTDVLGETGFDVPTLLGLHRTAPYLHDGTAATLEEVLNMTDHVGAALTHEDVDALVYFLLHLDSSVQAFD